MSEPDIAGRDLTGNAPQEHCRCGRLVRIRKEPDGRRRWWARCLCGRYVAHSDLSICRANMRGDK